MFGSLRNLKVFFGVKSYSIVPLAVEAESTSMRVNHPHNPEYDAETQFMCHDYNFILRVN